MSQNWAVQEIIPGSTAPATDITKLTDALASLKSQFSGASLPVANLVVGMPAIDAAGDFYIRNSANSDWVLIGNINSIRLGSAALNGDPTKTFSASTLSAATTIGVGAATPAASGAGITFPATQSASSDANTLDDYEEGTWTPTGNGITFSAASGTYTKIGRQATVTYDVTFPATGDTGQAQVKSLPFAPAHTGGGSVGYSEAANATRTVNDTAAQLYFMNAATIATNANCTGARVWGTHSFIV